MSTEPGGPPPNLQPLAGIKGDILFVQCPLSVANGTLIALGLLQSAIQMVHAFSVEKELKAAEQTMSEKNRLDRAIAGNGRT